MSLIKFSGLEKTKHMVSNGNGNIEEVTRKTPGGTIGENKTKLGFNADYIQRVNPEWVVGYSWCSRI